MLLSRKNLLDPVWILTCNMLHKALDWPSELPLEYELASSCLPWGICVRWQWQRTRFRHHRLAARGSWTRTSWLPILLNTEYTELRQTVLRLNPCSYYCIANNMLCTSVGSSSFLIQDIVCKFKINSYWPTNFPLLCLSSVFKSDCI